jgi:hypothetical protein
MVSISNNQQQQNRLKPAPPSRVLLSPNVTLLLAHQHLELANTCVLSDVEIYHSKVSVFILVVAVTLCIRFPNYILHFLLVVKLARAFTNWRGKHCCTFLRLYSTLHIALHALLNFFNNITLKSFADSRCFHDQLITMVNKYPHRNKAYAWRCQSS